jgi:hypothetical protein
MLLASDHAATREVLYRRNSAAHYTAMLRDSPGRMTPFADAADSARTGALRFAVRVAGGWRSLDGTNAARFGIAPGYPATLDSLAALRPLIVNAGMAMPGAAILAREVVTLPTHSWVTGRDRNRLLDHAQRAGA